MRHILARTLSIVGHPLCLLPTAALIVMASGGSTSLWMAASAFLLLSLVVLTFSWWQVRLGRWQHIDASQVHERRALNYFLAVLLLIAGFVSLRQSQAIGLTVGFFVSGGLVVVAILFSTWVKLSLHVAFAAFSTAILGYAGVELFAIGLGLTLALAWSRLELRRHTFVEVLTGGLLGSAAGMLFSVLLLYLAG